MINIFPCTINSICICTLCSAYCFPLFPPFDDCFAYVSVHLRSPTLALSDVEVFNRRLSAAWRFTGHESFII
ncbi:hypothetical protein BDV34DRAFT_6005 [Aspergillus parasiticus]|uniref:Uncharacterized protein n=1 Tax=Aspergillus parasiticus TaxID=5067 RepID=A0A5N6DXC1_ASPPA|nr:hypothetical protein BDV34DRAFT_6005 [Aspergillus parasiticus]